jgi:hypothetical protein
MTRKEIIKVLEIIKEEYEEMPVFAPRLPALDMAIQALKHPEIIRCKDCKCCEEVGPGLFFCDSVDIVPVGQYVEPDGFCSMARRRKQCGR